MGSPIDISKAESVRIPEKNSTYSSQPSLLKKASGKEELKAKTVKDEELFG